MGYYHRKTVIERKIVVCSLLSAVVSIDVGLY